MNISNEKRKFLFNLLDELSELDYVDLEKHYSKEIVSDLAMINYELLGNENVSNISTAREFSQLIYDLRQVKRTWSRQLGKVMIIAADRAAEGNAEEAITILTNFKKSCPSPFYNKNAQLEIERYKLQQT